jgi:hypothetical protein
LFKASGLNDTLGSSIIPVSKVLTGPYSVLIDGRQSGGVQTVLESSSDEISLVLSYPHRMVPNEIIIYGTRVVPEFDSLVVAVITAISIATLIVTAKFVRHRPYEQ